MIHPLDIITTILGLAYIILEYRASIWLWAVGFVMQAMGIVLYYDKGLYADCGMEFYYLSMTIYGFIAWRWGSKRGKGREERGEGSVMSVACGEAKDESDDAGYCPGWVLSLPCGLPFGSSLLPGPTPACLLLTVSPRHCPSSEYGHWRASMSNSG